MLSYGVKIDITDIASIKKALRNVPKAEFTLTSEMYSEFVTVKPNEWRKQQKTLRENIPEGKCEDRL